MRAELIVVLVYAAGVLSACRTAPKQKPLPPITMWLPGADMSLPLEERWERYCSPPPPFHTLFGNDGWIANDPSIQVPVRIGDIIPPDGQRNGKTLTRRNGWLLGIGGSFDWSVATGDMQYEFRISESVPGGPVRYVGLYKADAESPVAYDAFVNQGGFNSKVREYRAGHDVYRYLLSPPNGDEREWRLLITWHCAARRVVERTVNWSGLLPVETTLSVQDESGWTREQE